jgi:hypothetical protein|tara:strand:+ start:23036 stop:23278 length:243 start_codon:yes stop_codon:yes gene_type:complete
MSSPGADEAVAVDIHYLKLSIPETSADDGSYGDGTESGTSTPRYSTHHAGSTPPSRLEVALSWTIVVCVAVFYIFFFLSN